MTGEPRPPRAPVVTTWKTEGKAERAKANVPSAPSGEGPVLEWYQAEGNEMLKGGFALSALIIVFGCLQDWGFAWMLTWWLWLFVVWPPVVFYFLGRSGGYSAGADWLATRKKGYVKLYELSSVKVEHSAGGQSLDISLTDTQGGFAGASLRQVQRKRALWDLVYNGHRLLRPARAGHGQRQGARQAPAAMKRVDPFSFGVFARFGVARSGSLAARR